MIHSITARNVNEAFATAWHVLRVAGVEETSRNGPVLVAPDPVITTYTHPRQRVLFNPERDANAVFHLMESLWMLAGAQHVSWLEQFSSRISAYAEDDGNIHGAYGYRWRNHFGMDQVAGIVATLQKDPNSRQAVLQMWDPTEDLLGSWRDRPCNTAIYFDCRGGRLNMTVTCRSNDVLWGCYGANVVHMSVLQEVIAAALGVDVGVYRQFSNNWHAYLHNPQVQHFLSKPPLEEYDYYSISVDALPLVSPGETWQDFISDCENLVLHQHTGMSTAFMGHVAVPLYKAYLARQRGDKAQSVDNVPDCDWKLAYQQWCKRRDNVKQG